MLRRNEAGREVRGVILRLEGSLVGKLCERGGCFLFDFS